MTTPLFVCVIPKQTTDGSCTIPKSAWVDLTLDLHDIFNANLMVSDRIRAECDRERRPHYEVQVLLEGATDRQTRRYVVKFIERRIKRFVEKYSKHHIPLAR